jgi:hypothetical protein
MSNGSASGVPPADGGAGGVAGAALALAFGQMLRTHDRNESKLPVSSKRLNAHHILRLKSAFWL